LTLVDSQLTSGVSVPCRALGTFSPCAPQASPP